MIPLALGAWALACFLVFFLSLEAGAGAFRRLEARTLAAASTRLEALWLDRLPPRRLLHAVAIAALAVALLAGLALHPLAGLVAGISVLAVPPAALSVLQERRRRAFSGQLPEMLESLVSSLRSGFSLEQGLALAARQASAPMGQELGLTVRQAELGTTVEEALSGLALRMPGEDLALFVQAVTMSRETGGSLAEVLSELASASRKRRELEGRIRSLTAQGRLQAVVLALLPVVLGFAMYALQPDMMRRFLSSPKGWALMMLAVVLEVVGTFWIRRILKPDF